MGDDGIGIALMSAKTLEGISETETPLTQHPVSGKGRAGNEPSRAEL